MSEMSQFSASIMNARYAHTLPSGAKETWAQVAHRVATNVMGAVSAPAELVARIEKLIADRKFIPGGRYLYASGRELHQTQNCLLLRAEDTREGMAEHLYKVTMASTTGAGVGTVYSDLRAKGTVLKRSGGVASGPTALMQATNEVGRMSKQGGHRRAALWAGLHWNHLDVFEFISMKDWSDAVKAEKLEDFNFPAPMDHTNISVILDDEFFDAYEDVGNPLHSRAHDVYWQVVRRMCETGEPGFSIDVGVNAGEHLRNAPVSGETWVLTINGYRQVNDLLGSPVTLWTGKQWASTEFKLTKQSAPTVNVTMSGRRSIVADPDHEFFVEKYKGAGDRRKLASIEKVRAGELEEGDILHVSLPTPPTLPFNREAYVMGYVYGDGSFRGQTAEITFCTKASKLCAEPMRGHPWISSINEEDGRGFLRMYLKSPMFMGRTKEQFPKINDGLASFMAGLFDSDGCYSPDQNRVRLASKHYGFLEGARRALETLGIQSGIGAGGISTYGQNQGWLLAVSGSSVTKFAETIPCTRLQVKAYVPYRATTIKVLSVTPDKVQDVFCCDVNQPEHSFVAEGVVISNCCEVTSRDDSDICNIGSINMARITSLAEMAEAVELSTLFLLAGTKYSDLPYDKVGTVRELNRRLGLGLMGLHEWLLMRGLPYAPDPELEKYLAVYARSGEFAERGAKVFGMSVPVKTRAIAPTGTIGIVAETTTGVEPIFCAAYKRRFLDGEVWRYQYVLDPTAKRLVDAGMDPTKIEDAYSMGYEQRMVFQSWLQKFVDHGIASTINMPAWGSPKNNEGTTKTFGDLLLKHLPFIRGITAYPDGARGGQPLNPVPYAEAVAKTGQTFVEGDELAETAVEAMDVCSITRGESCGS